MTAMSMNPARPALFVGRAARPFVRLPAIAARPNLPIVVWCVAHLPGIVGRLGLALVPFSLLAWMFSV